MDATTAQLAALPLCRDFNALELAALTRYGEARTLAAGALLMRQGEAATGAYALFAGAVEVCRRLPGGGELPLAELTSGNLVGELGLIADTRRSADVRACTELEVFHFDRQRFAAACQLGEPTALRLWRGVIERVVALNRELICQIAAVAAPVSLMSPSVGPGPDALPDPVFEYAGFLPLLRAFQGFDAVGREQLAGLLVPRALARGECLYQADNGATGLAFVVRGALEVQASNGSAQTIRILGPGALAGLPAALDGEVHPANTHAREASLVLLLPQAAFAEHYQANGPLSLGLLRALAAFVAESALAHTNRLAQLTGLRRAQRLLAQQA